MSDADNFISDVMQQLEVVGRRLYGDAVKSYWVHASERCPCCAKRPIDFMDYKGERALSLSVFIYRERGVLIGYMLCPVCGQEVMRTSSKWQAKMHEDIERNLIAAYKRYLAETTNA